MPTELANVLFPFVLSPAALRVADRLVTALMTLIGAVVPLRPGNPTLTDAIAQTLFFRLGNLVARLARLGNYGLRRPSHPRSPTRPTAPADAPPPRRPKRQTSALHLPRRPGWLLDALPDTAPAIAAELRTLLIDADLTALLDAAPTLRRALRPLLRSLGLDAAPRFDDPPPDPRRAQPPHPAPSPSPRPQPARSHDGRLEMRHLLALA